MVQTCSRIEGPQPSHTIPPEEGGGNALPLSQVDPTTSHDKGDYDSNYATGSIGEGDS